MIKKTYPSTNTHKKNPVHFSDRPKSESQTPSLMTCDCRFRGSGAKEMALRSLPRQRQPFCEIEAITINFIPLLYHPATSCRSHYHPSYTAKITINLEKRKNGKGKNKKFPCATRESPRPHVRNLLHVHIIHAPVHVNVCSTH